MSADGVRLEISNQHDDDYLHRVWTVAASRGEDRVEWKIPDRLIERRDVAQAIQEEIVAELDYYTEHIAPIVNAFRSKS